MVSEEAAQRQPLPQLGAGPGPGDLCLNPRGLWCQRDLLQFLQEGSENFPPGQVQTSQGAHDVLGRQVGLHS
eukprot:bmy_10564T0